VRICSQASDTDDGLEVPTANPAHTIAAPKAAGIVRVPIVRALVNEGPHEVTTSWNAAPETPAPSCPRDGRTSF
jgi:hypothetical protein